MFFFKLQWTPPRKESAWSRCSPAAYSSASSVARKSNTTTRSGRVNNATIFCTSTASPLGQTLQSWITVGVARPVKTSVDKSPTIMCVIAAKPSTRVLFRAWCRTPVGNPACAEGATANTGKKTSETHSVLPIFSWILYIVCKMERMCVLWENIQLINGPNRASNSMY